MKADHARDPTEDHKEFTKEPTEMARNMADVGLGDYVHAEADAETLHKALGPQMDDATFLAASIKATTDAEVKAAQKALKEVLKAAMPPPKRKWNPRDIKTMNSTWVKEEQDLAEATIQSTSRIPSSVQTHHVHTGAVAKKGPNKRGAGADASGSAVAKKAKKDTSSAGSSD